MIAVDRLRRSRGNMHACLASHSHGSFSLTPHLTRLRTSNSLASIFTSIIEATEDRDVILPALAEAVAGGTAPHGFLRRTDFPTRHAPEYVKPIPPALASTFASEPIVRLRLSRGRCYWNRCTFCVQTEHESVAAPSLREIPAALNRLASFQQAGCRSFIFADAALSPAFLRQFCRGVLNSGMVIRWACRCKLERSYTLELFQQIYAAGCREVLFGLESISATTMRRMDKLVDGLDGAAIERICKACDSAGIGVHINLIAGFPGETITELDKSVEFLSRVVPTLKNATFSLNQFILFSAAPMMKDPLSWGVLPVVSSDDMPLTYHYRVPVESQQEAKIIDRALPALRKRLTTALGWDRFGDASGPKTALELYSETGHGLLLKT